ncbi:hypothetical protein EYF80_034732 [Liparis tanakae]|uniref:Uncharacterized protein n=1 Tax=Liparis tanakae TaxID=230148 RepID=A0A4Z2GND7_9TELE|nr:hypothetical protein EYF80_034732 [Liparis tanakae]
MAAEQIREPCGERDLEAYALAPPRGWILWILWIRASAVETRGEVLDESPVYLPPHTPRSCWPNVSCWLEFDRAPVRPHGGVQRPFYRRAGDGPLSGSLSQQIVQLHTSARVSQTERRPPRPRSRRCKVRRDVLGIVMPSA